MTHFARPVSLALIVSLLSAYPGATQNLPMDVLPHFRPEAIHAHMNFLADDLLEGRGTGARGYELGSKYVAAQFEADGLEPGGEDGTYFQRVPLRKATIVAERSSLTIRDGASSRTLRYGIDFTFRADPKHTQTNITAPVVIIGYGVTVPEFGIDDFAGIDVKGKIVAVIAGAPSSLPDIPHAIYASLDSKLENAAAHGAVGLWTLRTATGPVPKANPVTVWKDKAGTPHGIPDRIQSIATISRDIAASLLEKSTYGIEQLENATKNGRFRAIDSGIVATAAASNEYTDFTAPNVAAISRGSDTNRNEEYVVFTAHLDHLGIGEPVNGDAIYNGALDNASGIAVLLELARVFAAAPKARRSVLFLAVTGEELGLLGSDYFAANPTVPRNRIVANINGDGASLEPIRQFLAIGADESTLNGPVNAAAHVIGLEIVPNRHPEQNAFVRSDHYSFARRGIVSVYPFPGTFEEVQNGEAPRYHTPSDDMNHKFDFDAGVVWERFQFLLTYSVANADLPPQWNPDSFLGKKFGKNNP
jgi:hypothetical protein